MESSNRHLGSRQVLKTHALLRDALSYLIRRKEYDAITIKDILDRANVGRSTFYVHFRDKDELLDSCILHILESLRPSDAERSASPYERILWFGRPVFEHIDHHMRMDEARLGHRGRFVIHQRLEQSIVDWISDDVREGFRGIGKPEDGMSADLLTRFIASTFILVLGWWLESRNPLSPQKINERYRALVLPALISANMAS